ncbi:uncharacterized protein [Hoplias malabaricus]|uniref:uncharacterized protein n=1 Tax=Hoplias malabaricus TaxID=27720 RepID=UPI0034623017
MQVCVYLLLVLHVAEGCRLENYRETKEITAYTGESVLLPCYCTDTRSTPETFTWRKHNPSKNRLKDIFSGSAQYRGRVQLFNSHSPGNLSLLISHLTEEDGGLYRCKAKGSGLTFISLTVKDLTEEDREEDAGSGYSDITPILLDVEDSKIAAIPTTSTTEEQGREDSSKNNTICAAVGVSLLWMALGGVICWRYRAQRRGRTESQTGSRGGQETQDDALVLYATVNKKDTHQEEQEQDDVTYSTVVHNKPSTSAHTLLDTGDTTEYACIKHS